MTNGPDAARGGLGGGWDIILPAGWGASFFSAFVHAGARAVGLREARYVDHVMLTMR